MKILLLVVFLFPLEAPANKILIEEIESLRNALSFKDKARPEMTLRLADLYFEEAREAEKKLLLEGKGSKKDVTRYRKRPSPSIRNPSRDKKVSSPRPAGELAVKIHFQLARLHHRILDTTKAVEHYSEVVGNNLPIGDIKRESHLGLAEIFEGKNQDAKARGHYTKGLGLCKKSETCTYIHYKRSWVLYRMGELEGAIDDVEKSLFDTRGQVQGEVSSGLYPVFIQ